MATRRGSSPSRGVRLAAMKNFERRLVASTRARESRTLNRWRTHLVAKHDYTLGRNAAMTKIRRVDNSKPHKKAKNLCAFARLHGRRRSSPSKLPAASAPRARAYSKPKPRASGDRRILLTHRFLTDTRFFADCSLLTKFLKNSIRVSKYFEMTNILRSNLRWFASVFSAPEA